MKENQLAIAATKRAQAHRPKNKKIKPPPEGWVDESACRGLDSDIFFSEWKSNEAKAICSGCTVLETCLEYSWTHRVANDGVFGGLTKEERATLFRKWRASGCEPQYITIKFRRDFKQPVRN